MTDGLKDAHREAIIATLAANDRVERAVLFGSRATGTNTVSSDVDIALFGNRLTLTDQARLAAALDEIPMAQSVDLVLHDSVQNRALREHIRSEGVAWYERPRQCSGLPGGTTHPRSLPPPESIYWPLVPARDLFKLTYGRALAAPARRPGNVPVYGTNGRCGFHDAALFEGPGVILGRKGQGPLGVEWADGPYWVIDTAYTLTPLRQDVDLRFAYYLLKLVGLNHLKDGTSNPTLSRETFGAQALPFPPTPSQRAIAQILGSLDDKIELNRRVNATLEAMVRALFRSWFVDFDPVRAKMDGRDTGLPKEVADLFPERLVDSELGEMPAGWTVGTLGDVAAAPRSGIDPGQAAADTPYIGLEHMPRRSVALTDWGGAGSVSSTKTAFENRDVLFGKLRPYFHKVGIAPVNGVCSTDIVVLKARMPGWSAFVLACVSSSAFVGYASQTSTGTKMPRTSWRTMSSYEICRPAVAVAAAFQHIVSPMFERIVANVHESRTLGRLRDALLPKLVSGELRVPDAEKLAGAFA